MESKIATSDARHVTTLKFNAKDRELCTKPMNTSIEHQANPNFKFQQQQRHHTAGANKKVALVHSTQQQHRAAERLAVQQV